MANSTSSNSGRTSSESNLKDDIDALKTDLAALKDDLKSTLDAALAEGKASARDAKHRVEAKVGESSEALEEKIVTNPFTSVAVATGVGVLLGLYLRGR